MNELMTVNKMTSIQIAEITGKQHQHVMRDIRDEIEKLQNAGVNTESKFGPRERDGLTGKIPYYELSTEGVLQLAARYDAVVRAKLIEMAMKQDKPQIPGTYKEALIALVAAEEEKERLLLDNTIAETKLEEQKPMVLFAETCIASKDSILVRELAKLASKNGLVIGEKRLYRRLREWGLILEGKTEPSQYAMNAGWFEIKKGTYNSAFGSVTTETTMVTPKGQIYIVEKLKKELSNNIA